MPVDPTTIRLHIYRHFIRMGKPPSVEQTADTLGIPQEDAAEAYRRLADGHSIVLEPDGLDIWMANPLSARTTGFRVRSDEGREYFGTCAWDAPGVLAMLDADGTVATTCPDCDEPLTLEVRGGELQPVEAVGHFAVPAARWWEDIGFT
jgi:hypothetical protein